MIDPPPEPPEEPPKTQGALRPISPQSLVGWGLAGLVAGWLFHWYADAELTTVPTVSWRQPVALFLVAAILVLTARATSRAVREVGQRLTAQQAVNRLVLARACAYVGALMTGGHLGYAIRSVASWVGVSAEMVQEAAVRSSFAVVGGACVTVGALVLERACRVRNDQDGP